MSTVQEPGLDRLLRLSHCSQVTDVAELATLNEEPGQARESLVDCNGVATSRA